MMENYLIKPDVNVRSAIQAIDEGKKKVIFIANDSKRLLGIFTDGDMRRYILKNGDLSAPISAAMNPTPITYHSIEEAMEAKKREKMVVYPIVNEEGILINALFWNEPDKNCISSTELAYTPLVIMAGGKGTRIYPYTKILPKPLIPIGDYTISERIINNFRQYGLKKVCFVLNHKASMIKSYYNDLDRDYDVDYVVENKFLGTGGGLSLLKGKIDSTFFVSNCDILINADLECIYRTHKMQKNKITFVCAMKNVIIPYGVIDLDESGRIKRMIEKPSFSFLTNTGLYVLEPEVIERMKEDEFIHLPQLAQQYIDNGENVGVFPISEKSWLDMGELSEMESMMKELGV